MNTSSAAVPRSQHGLRQRNVLVLLLAASIVSSLVLGSTGVTAARGENAYNNVQVTISATSASMDYFSSSVFNSTGGLVASYQSQYPVASFELSPGNYIFTANAMNQTSSTYPPSPVPLQAASSTVAAPQTGSASGTMIKCCVYQPSYEYGYTSIQVGSSTSVNIQTKPLNATSSSTVTIQVKYPNGTAAANSYVSASVLGDQFGWSYAGESISLYGNTDDQGIVRLTAPTAPLLVSASASVPVVLPYNQTVIPLTVAGEQVNVTAYWEPNYLSFGGQTLVLPPQTSGTITLKYEPQSYPVVYGTPASSSANSGAGVATGSAPTAGTGKTSQQPPSAGTTTMASSTLQAAQTVASTSSRGSVGIPAYYVFLSIGAIAVAALGVALFVSKGHTPASKPGSS